MGTTTVGRKKKPEPEPNRKPVAINIKGDPLWTAWVERAASHARMSVSAYVDVCLARGAKADGFDEKPPERLP